MRRALWPKSGVENLEAEASRLMADVAQAVFVAVRSEGGLGGFVEVSMHPNAIGCVTYPVGYIEGWYVDGDLRRRGIGQALLEAGEAWAAAQGCREVASDAELTNEGSIAAHHACGYETAGTLIHFRKRLE